MGLTEEGGKVAAGITESLKGAPGLLALIVLMVAILALVAYGVSARASQSHVEMMSIIDRCMPSAPQRAP